MDNTEHSLKTQSSDGSDLTFYDVAEDEFGTVVDSSESLTRVQVPESLAQNIDQNNVSGDSSGPLAINGFSCIASISTVDTKMTDESNSSSKRLINELQNNSITNDSSTLYSKQKILGEKESNEGKAVDANCNTSYEELYTENVQNILKSPIYIDTENLFDIEDHKSFLKNNDTNKYLLQHCETSVATKMNDSLENLTCVIQNDQQLVQKLCNNHLISDKEISDSSCLKTVHQNYLLNQTQENVLHLQFKDDDVFSEMKEPNSIVQMYTNPFSTSITDSLFEQVNIATELVDQNSEEMNSSLRTSDMLCDPQHEEKNDTVLFRNLDTGEEMHVPVNTLDRTLEEKKQFFLNIFQGKINGFLSNDGASYCCDDSISNSSDEEEKTTLAVVSKTAKLKSLFHWSRSNYQVSNSAVNQKQETEETNTRHDRLQRFSKIWLKSSAGNKEMTNRVETSQVSLNPTNVQKTKDFNMTKSSDTALPASEPDSYVKASISTQSLARSSDATHANESLTAPWPWYNLILRNSLNAAALPVQLKTRLSLNKSKPTLTNLWLAEELHCFQPVSVWSLSVDPTGTWIAAGLQNGTIELWTFSKSKTSQSPDSTPSVTSPDSANSSLSVYAETVDLASTNSPNENVCSHSQQSPTDIPQNDGSASFSVSLSDDVSTKYQSCRLSFLHSDVQLRGHKATVVMTVWDQKDVLRLASASLDQTVRIWLIPSNLKRKYFNNPICTIIDCADWATSVVFHPSVPEFVYTSSLNGAIQCWRVDGYQNYNWNSVRSQEHSSCQIKCEPLDSIKMSELATSMTISPNGLLIAIGFSTGRVSLYEAKTLRFCSEIECRNSRGRFADGRKVTGITWSSDSMHICVTTSDSRIRVINLADASNWLKFKGHRNSQMMLYCMFTPSEKQLICASETSWIYLWDIDSNALKSISSEPSLKPKKLRTCKNVERFKAFQELVTSCNVANQNFFEKMCDGLKTSSESSRPSLEQIKNFLSSKKYTDFKCPVAIIVGSCKGIIRIFINLA